MEWKQYIVLIFSLIIQPALSQQTTDFTKGRIDIYIDPLEEYISGNVDYSFDVLLKTDSIEIDARQMKINAVKVNRKDTDYTYKNDRITIYRKFRAGKTYSLNISYETSPSSAVYFIGWHDKDPTNNQVWTQGQGKYSSHWVPGFDDMSEKLVYDLHLTFNDSYEVVANGHLSGLEVRDSLKTWTYTMKRPMSSYLLAFVAGSYFKDTVLSSSGVPIELYSYPNVIERREPTYRYTTEIMNFLEEEIGVAYPWQNYKQIPVRDFLYAGMENTGTTIFSDSYFIDSLAFTDKNYVEVNAHEMAHQWFGNLVTEVGAKDHWLHEGFATYYALLAQRNIFGDEHFYWKLFQTAEALKEHPGESLTDPKASSLTFYEKGAWAIVMLRQLVGDVAFKNSIERFLEKFAFKSATIDDFLSVVGEETTIDLNEFKKTWLFSPEFPYELARQYLIEQSDSVKAWYDLRWELTSSNEENEIIIQRYWKAMNSNKLKTQILSKFTKSLSVPFIQEILNSGDAELRKAIAIYLERIPPDLKSEFETLLEDPSYVTMENALFKLWIYFPDDRLQYLDVTHDIDGLPNKNVRILWLFLATLTNNFNSAEARLAYREELFGYTSPAYPFEVRQMAFTLITEVFDLPEQNLKDLINASVHHTWQFREFARNLLSEIMKDEQQKARLVQIAQELNGQEQRYLIKQLEGK